MSETFDRGDDGQRPEAPLTDKEREQVRRLLSDPFSFPPDFYEWIKRKIEADPPHIITGSIQGFAAAVNRAILREANNTYYAQLGAEVNRSSAVFGDPTNIVDPGPTLNTLPPGEYIVIYGGSGTGTLSTNTTGLMGVSANGGSPADFLEAQGNGHFALARAVVVTLNLSGDTNQLKCVYAGSDGTNRFDFRYRWILAFRLPS